MITIQTNPKFNEIAEKRLAEEAAAEAKKRRLAEVEKFVSKLFRHRFEVSATVKKFFSPAEEEAYYGSRIFIACLLESPVLDVLADKIAAKFAASSLATAVATQANKDALAAATKRAEEARARAEELKRAAAAKR